MSRDEVFGKFEELKEILGTEKLLEELSLAMNVDELKANLEHIDRMNDTNIM